MAVAGEFHGADPFKTGSEQTVERVTEVEIAIPQSNMLMEPPRTVRQVDVHQPRRPVEDRLTHRLLSGHHAVTKVQGQTELIEGWPAPLEERSEASWALDEHAGLWLEGDLHSRPPRVLQHPHEPLHQAVAERVVRVHIEGAVHVLRR